MIAVRFTRIGEPADVLSVEAVPTPVPAAGAALVAVQASVIQPADSMFIRGRYRIRPSFPQIAGLEGTGVVVDARDSTIPNGTRVGFRHPGTWAEYIVVPANRCYRVPDGTPIDVAAQFALNPVTAWALLDELAVLPGEWIALSAARSAVARLVAGLAGHRSVEVLGITRSMAGDLPPYPVIDLDPNSANAEISVQTGGAPLAGFLDSVGGVVLESLIPMLRTGATIVSYGVLDDRPIAVRNSDLIYRNLTWKGFGIDHWLSTHAHVRDAMTAELWKLLEAGVIELPVAAVYALEDIHHAVRAAASTRAGAKVIIHTHAS
jgi:NADPH:quinone reductase-like Zn-dependent oxidoreductase